MRPCGDRTVTNGFDQCRSTLHIFFLGKYPREVKVIPTHDGVFDQSPTGLRDLLVLLLALDELVAVAERNGLGKFIRALYFVELLFDGLPERGIITVL